MEAPPEYPSAEAVRAELNVEQEALLKRGDAADSRAGVLLGSAGALSALALNAKSLWVLPGVAVALVSAVFATRVLWPRPMNTLNPIDLYRLYLAKPESVTKHQALTRRVADYQKNLEWVDGKRGKYACLKIAIGSLAAAIVLVVLGMSFDLLRKHL